MEKFEFHNPTRIVFGRGEVDRAGREASVLGKRCLLVTGSGSARRSGLLDRVATNMKDAGVSVVLLEGVVPNPRLSLVRRGIEIVRDEGLDFICALGGGSVMDTAKAIAAGAELGVDIWEVFEGRAEIEKALPVMTIPTLAASGSEMNGFMVITNEESGHKLATGSILVYPRVSILDPELTYSVPENHTAYGGVDAVCHLMEPYFNGPDPHTPVQDAIAEGLMKTIMRSTEACLESPRDYEARASMMWGATLALNGLTKAGVGDHLFPVHMMEHAVSAIYDVPHGAGLAALLPGWMRWRARRGEGGKIAKFGQAVMGIHAAGDDRRDAEAAALAFSQWLARIGCPERLSAFGIGQADVGAIADNALKQASIWGADDRYDRETMIELLSFCL